jgi:hypothetical protein
VTNFEDGLWERLVEEHNADHVSITAPRTHADRRLLVVGGSLTASIAAVAAAAVGIIGSVTSTPPAYAMTQHADGSVTVTINDVARSVAAVNARFAAMGIDETVVPVESSCTDTGNIGQELWLDPEGSMSQSLTFTPGVPASWKQGGYTGVIAAEQLSNGKVAMTMEAIKPPVPTCFPATAYKLMRIGSTNGVPTFTKQTVTPSGK